MVNYAALANSLLKLTFIINMFTICGSILSFITFSRKAFQKSSIGFYCKSLAIFDLFVLFVTVFGIASQILNVQLIASNDTICKIVYYISISSSPIQGWLLIVFSIDQLIAVSMTDRFGFVKKRWFQFSITLAIFIFHCGIYIPVFFNVGSISATFDNVTYYNCVSFSFQLSMTYLIEASFIPFVIMIIITVRIVRLLVKSRKRTSIHSLNGISSVRARDFRFAFNSVILNILFILLTTPLVVYYVVPVKDFIFSGIFNLICFAFFYLNYALHFWVHLFVNSYFRNEVFIMLRFRRDRKQSRIISVTPKINNS